MIEHETWSELNSVRTTKPDGEWETIDETIMRLIMFLKSTRN